MKLEDVGSCRWGTRCASYRPLFVSFRPSLWSLWAALTHLADFTFKPRALADPLAIEESIGDTTFASLVVVASACASSRGGK
jgi:hypothetical protein